MRFLQHSVNREDNLFAWPMGLRPRTPDSLAAGSSNWSDSKNGEMFAKAMEDRNVADFAVAIGMYATSEDVDY
jgi:hypothetical protein